MKNVLIVSIVLLAGTIRAGTYSGGDGIGDPYKIANVDDFLELSSTPGDWYKSFILTADIDLTDLPFTQAPIAPDIDSATSNFQGTQFTGVFDGNGHTISNLTITAPTKGYIGLFGYIGSDGQIRNLGVKNVNITSRNYVGGLCGQNSGGTISQSYVTGTVTGNNRVGGLCGWNANGIIGQSYAIGAVTGNSSVGGLCGSTSGTISQSYATGSVTGTGSDVGGLCGYSYYGTIISSYATGPVIGMMDYVGGLCGNNGDFGTISQCYASGAVSGSSLVGGLVGHNYYGTITSCFWDIDTSGTTDGVGNMNPDPAGVIGKTTVEMQTRSTFTTAGWDFVGETVNGKADIWRMCIDGIDYPRLNWQYSFGGDMDCPNGVGLEDLLYLAGRWLETTAEPFDGADVTGDKRVDILDFTVLSENWH